MNIRGNIGGKRPQSISCSVAVFAFAVCAFSAAGTADEYDVSIEQPRYGTGRIYTTHAPGLKVPGRYQAGPCTVSPESNAYKSADYEPGLDAHGNAVVVADLPLHSAIHWGGPSFVYLFQRTPTATETRFGLEPRDYVAVDTGDGTVTYNNWALNSHSGLPPVPDHCD